MSCRARIRVPARRSAGRDDAATRGWCSSPTRTTPPGVPVPAGGDPGGRTRVCHRRQSFSSTRRTRIFRRALSSRDLTDFPNVIVGRTFSKAYGLAGLRIGRDRRRAEDASTRCAGRFRSTASTSPRLPRSRRRSGSRLRRRLPAAGRRIEGAGVRGVRSRSGFNAGRAPRISCSSASAPHVEALVDDASGTRHLPARPVEPSLAARVASGSTTGSRRAHAARPRGPRGGSVRRAVIDRRTNETAIWLSLTSKAGDATTSAPGSDFSITCSSLFARHGGVRSPGEGARATSTWTSTIRSRTSASRSARRCPRRSATVAASTERVISSCRWTKRWPSSRSTSVAGRTPWSISRSRSFRVGDLQTELVHDFFEGFAAGARANVHVKVMYGRSSHHKIEAVFKAFAPRAARGLRKGQAPGANAAQRRRGCYDAPGVTMIALIDYGAGNLTSVKKALAAVGADVVRARAQPDAISLDATAIIVPGVGHFAATRALDALGRRHSRARCGRSPAARHLPRHAVALRRQRGSARLPRARRLAGRCWRLSGGRNGAAAEGSARRLEFARRC